MDFKDLELSDGLLQAIEESGYKTPTPIQEQAIPIILMGRDVLGIAQTGTGKTASFTLPMIDILSGGRAKARMPRSLILSPTRELAAQISDNFVKYGKNKTLTMALIVGGTSMDDQIKNLDKGVDVLIATPGRLLDLFGRGKILLADIKILVIDEADRMLDMGFIPDLEKIASLLPPMRQTLFFSATMPPEIKKLSERFLSNPKVVSVSAPASTAVNVEQYLVNVTHFKQKQAAFLNIAAQEEIKNAFVFCNRKRDIDEVCRFMKSRGMKCTSLHGDKEQDARTAALSAFKGGEVQILVCSDVAARGLDVQGMSHVFNWDVPNNSEDYVHRIGRTGRAGAKGRSFTFVTPNDAKTVLAIQKLIGKNIEVFPLTGEAAVQGVSVETAEPVTAQPAVPHAAKRPPRASAPKREAHKAPQHNRPAAEKHSPVAEKRNPVPDNRPRRDEGRIHTENNDGSFGDDVPSFLKRK
jgi:superfamily II DNA/RNA helicase